MPVVNPHITQLFLFWEDEDDSPPLGPPIVQPAERWPLTSTQEGHDLCWMAPAHMCAEDLNADIGGEGEWHKVLDLIYKWLFGTQQLTGIMDDVANWSTIFDIETASSEFLTAMLQHLGFNFKMFLLDEDKRRILRFLAAVYKAKGTQPGVELAVSVLLNIPATVYPSAGSSLFDGFEAGPEPQTTLSLVTTGTEYVEVDFPERFAVGKILTIVDQTAAYAAFEPTPILSVVSNRIYFEAQTLAHDIEAGAVVWCDEFHNEVGDPEEADDDQIYPVGYDTLYGDDGLFVFHVDIQRTVETMADLEAGDTEVELSDVSFIIPGSLVRLTDQTAPLNDVLDIRVKTVDTETNIVTFAPIVLTQTLEAGALARNMFTNEQLDLISEVIRFAKTSHTTFVLTRDQREDLVETLS